MPPPEPEVVVGLPAIPGALARQRLEIAVSLARNLLHRMQLGAMVGDMLYAMRGGELVIYRLKELTDTIATFELRGHLPQSPLANVFQPQHHELLAGPDGLVYAVGDGIKAFVSDPSRPRVAGHFQSPTAFAHDAYVLPDGRLVVAADKVYLLAPPRRR